MTLRIGIDLGGSKIAAVLIDAGGESLCSLRRPTPHGDYAGTLDAIAGIVDELDREAGTECPVGIGTPGAWVEARRAMKNCNSTWLNGQPLLIDLERRLERPLRIANDANCFALSEALAGAGQGSHVVFGVILGTGVGGGWVVGGELISGANSVAGEWGHTPLPYFRADAATAELEVRLGDRACYCGRDNCVESFLSGPGLEKTHDVLWAESTSAEVIGKRSTARQRATLDLYTTMLARALAQVVNTVDPDVIVLGGGVSNIGWLYPSVRSAMARYGFSHEGRTRLVAAQHGDSSGVLGAAWLNPA